MAALLSGCAVGAISLVFTDITQGLGCAVGGFCLAMWLLTLKSGGLISSTGGRAGLIAAFTLAAFGLSFSHYTRHYGLLGCMAFGGATAVVLGIDCYSRAGLKEFWMYIWGRSREVPSFNPGSIPVIDSYQTSTAPSFPSILLLILLLGASKSKSQPS